MINIIQIIILVLVLMILHEVGHVIAAKILDLEVYQVGVCWKPYPHFFVAAEWPQTEKQRLIYLFSGSLVTVILFILASLFHFFYMRSLYHAFAIQLLIETNPFYSDFTIASITKSKLNDPHQHQLTNSLYQDQLSTYLFSRKWYIHFIIWAILLILLIKYNHLFAQINSKQAQ